jgi:hypothetical protein
MYEAYHAAVEAFALTPLRNATVLSLVFAALLLQICGQETHDLVLAAFLAPGDQRPVAADLICSTA